MRELLCDIRAELACGFTAATPRNNQGGIYLYVSITYEMVLAVNASYRAGQTVLRILCFRGFCLLVAKLGLLPTPTQHSACTTLDGV